MGYWGIAMSHWYPLWFPPSPSALKAGAEAVEKAVAAAPKTEREKDYIDAIAAFHRDSDKLDHGTRAVAYEKAMEQVYLRYPEDREAAVFCGLALNASALPTDKTYANKRKAAEILNKVWAEQPNHPGVVHYLIHSDDSPEFAAAGLDAAICYSKIAPDVPHALHMPSHIFTRLGMWQQSIDSNRAAHAAALAYVRKTLGPESFDTETASLTLFDSPGMSAQGAPEGSRQRRRSSIRFTRTLLGNIGAITETSPAASTKPPSIMAVRRPATASSSCVSTAMPTMTNITTRQVVRRGSTSTRRKPAT
jgi:hypothetical protein